MAERDVLTQKNLLVVWSILCGVLFLLGIVVGEGLATGMAFCLPLALGSLWLCARRDPDGRLDLVSVFLLALTLRWAAAVSVQLLVYRTSPGLFAPDENGYDVMARYVGEALAGHAPMPPEAEDLPKLVWLNGLLYYVLGYGILAPKLLSGLGGAWSAALVTLIASRLVPPAAARRAGLLAAVFPSLILWSILILKDPWTLLGNEIALYALLTLRDGLRPGLVLLFALGFGLVGANRPYELLFTAAAVPTALLTTNVRRLGRHLVVLALLAMLALAILQMTDALSVVNAEDAPTLERFAALRSAYSEDAGSAVRVSLVNTSGPLGLLLWLPIGLSYFLLAPIPFTGTSSLSLTTSPEMLIWYGLLPSLWRGARDLVRSPRRAQLAPLLSFVIVASIAWATIITNVGSLYRYRSQILFLPLIFIAADQVRRKKQRRESRGAPPLALTARPIVSATRLAPQADRDISETKAPS